MTYKNKYYEMKRQNGNESIKTGLEELLSKPRRKNDSSQISTTSQIQEADPEQMEHMLSVPDADSRLTAGRPRKGDNRPRMLETNKRTSLTVDKELYATLCQIAYDNGLSIKDVMNAALRKYISLYEAKHGPVTLRESHISADSLV
jgi:hypothetical protein